jgi:hypothetical protein
MISPFLICISGLYNIYYTNQMETDTSKLRQKLRNIEEARTEHVQSILQEQGPIQGGSLVKILRKCGKPNCHCATGSGHPTTYLSSKEDGKTRMVYIASAIEPAITQQTQRYRHLRQHRSSLVKLAQQSLELIDQLQEALHTTKPVVTPTIVKGRKR